MISLLNKSQRPLVANGRFWTENLNPRNTRLLSSATISTGKQSNTSHQEAPSSKEDPERLLNMYNNENQSVLEDLDHPDNKPVEETTVTSESDANSIFDD